MPHLHVCSDSGSHRQSAFIRLLLAFGVFALGLVLAMGMAAYFSARNLSMEFLAKRADLLLGAVLQAENYTRSGRESPQESANLIEPLGLEFLAGKEVEGRLAAMPDGIHLINDGANFVFIRHIDTTPYAIKGSIATKGAILKDLAAMLAACALAGLCAAAVFALLISRLLARPAQALANAIGNSGPERKAAIAAELLGRRDELGVLARALVQYQQKMSEYMEREKSFTSAASHELRTPLTIISQGIELLEAQDKLPDKARRTIARLKATSDGMQRQVSSLLALARSENLEPEIIDPEEELLAALKLLYPGADFHFEPAARDARIALRVCKWENIWITGRAGVAFGSKNLAIAVFRNLLENAIHHGSGGAIRIMLGDGQIRIVNQGDFVPQASENPGFGLQIAWRACERMGWNLDLQTGESETCFIITLGHKHPK